MNTNTWREKNKEEAKKWQADYREKNREKYNEYARNWREKNKDKINERIRKNYPKNKEKHNATRRIEKVTFKERVYIFYSKGEIKCRCCGEKEMEFLVLDHINDDGAKHRKETGLNGGLGLYRWIIKNNFPDIFQVLCHNCNWSKRHTSGICIHKREKIT